MSKPLKINVVQSPGVLCIWLDYGFGARLSASIPTGDRAAYPEAIERNRVEANEKLRGHLARILSMYPDAQITGMEDVKIFEKETRSYWWGSHTAIVAEFPANDRGRVTRAWEVWERADGSRYSVVTKD